MRVRVLFFGILRDLIGCSEQELELPEDARLETVFDHYASQFPRVREMSDSIVLARNEEFAARDGVLADGDEVALMPPVSGGAGDDAASAGAAAGTQTAPWLASAEDERGFYALTSDPIDVEELKRRTAASSVGAVLTFEGVVRDNSSGRRTRYLDYDCYRPLALRTMRELGREILEVHDVHAVAMAHRLGRLEIGEASVAIVVSSAHRRAAYEAGFDAINRLKKTVPVWKKEYFEDGEIWVEGEWDQSVPR